MKLLPFDTRDTKPKLYDLLILTAVFLLTEGVLFYAGAGRSKEMICIIAAVYFFLAAGILFYSFREQIKYNPYSYNTIFYFGFGLFALSLFITYTILTAAVFKRPESYGVSGMLHLLLGSAMNYIILSMPFLVLFSAALCVSNIFLIRHEGRRPLNLLGTALSLLIVPGAFFLFYSDRALHGSGSPPLALEIAANCGAALYLYFECMMIGAVVAGAVSARHEPDKDKDFLIILGCGLKKDGSLSGILKGRVDRALLFYEDQKRKTGKELFFITSGGQGEDEVITESRAMKEYLVSKGVPGEKVIEEDRSTTTFENMKFSKEIVMKKDPKGKVVFSTTNYHVFRSGLLSRRVKMRAQGIGAKTKWYFWPNAAVREFAGLLSAHRVKQGLILGGMIAFYALFTVWSHAPGI